MARDGQFQSDFERALQASKEIPVYAAVDKYSEFQQTLDRLLQHPIVRSRIEHFALLLARDSSIGDEGGRADPTKALKASGEYNSLVRDFRGKFIEGMRRTSSPAHPRELSDERGIPVDRSKLVTYTDLKVAILREVVRDAFQQLLQHPGEPRKDQLLVDKILSLISADGLSQTETRSIREPAMRAVVGAFADTISSPAFILPAKLSPTQQKLLEAVFRAPITRRDRSHGLVAAVVEEAREAAFWVRRTFLRGEYDSKWPQELRGVKLQDTEKAVLSIIESMSRIERAMSLKEIDPEKMDLSAHTFGADRTTWAGHHIPAETIQVIQSFVRCRDLEQVVHRAHNLPTKALSYLLSQAFERVGLPRAIWPNRESGGDDVLPSTSPGKGPR